MASDKISKETLLEIYSKISWILLEQKCLYYVLTHSKYDKCKITDTEYDLIEKRYVEIGKHIGESTHISEMVGFKKDYSATTKMVYKKLKETKKSITIGKNLYNILETMKLK
jgi:hypothetical protein